MFYILIIFAVVITVVVLRFIYKKTQSIKLINSFELVDNVLYKDKVPYSETVRVSELDGSRTYFAFTEGKLNYVSLHMSDGATAYWRVGNKYTTCYNKEGKALSQVNFEILYSRPVDAGNLLDIFNRNFKKCHLSI